MATGGYALLGDRTVIASMQGRMERQSTTEIRLNRYVGDLIEVNGELVALGAGGLVCLTTDNLISATGTDSGGAMAASTLYYVYASNSSASFAPSDLRASATAPTRGTTAGTSRLGIYYLADSGNGANWRFVGWVRTDGSTNFVDTTTDRLIVNYYNRLDLSILLQPGYVDDNATTSYTLASGTYVALNGGTGATASYIANGEDAVTAYMAGSADPAAGQSINYGIGDNATTTAYGATLGNVTVRTHAAIPFISIPAVGYRTLSLIGSVSGGTTTIYADTDRDGGTTDPRATYLQGTVMG